MSEAQIEKKVCEWASENSVLAIKFTPMGSTGWPDRVFLYQGRVLFIEFKAPGKKARPLQEERAKQLRAQGFITEVHSNVETAKQAIHTTLISGDGYQVGIKPSLRRVFARPGTGQDNDHVQHLHDLAAAKVRQEDARDMSLEACMERLAQAKGHVGRV